MKKLIVITVFVLLGMLANSAMAKDRDQRIVSPVLIGNIHECLAVNTTRSTLEINYTFVDTLGDDIASVPFPLSAGSTNGFNVTDNAFERLVYCAFEWVGKPQDFVLTICAVSINHGRTCLNVR
jgi:hypothetical protein